MVLFGGCISLCHLSVFLIVITIQELISTPTSGPAVVDSTVVTLISGSTIAKDSSGVGGGTTTLEPVRFLPAQPSPQQLGHRRRSISSTTTTTTSSSDVTFHEMPQGDSAQLPAGISQQMLVSPQDPCSSFTNVDVDRQEFYSPGYPAEIYPNHTECVLVLEAPPGHLIKLDFRDWFALEQSTDCKNDYLEVRDGAHGYNNLVEQPFCGNQFPPMITSSDRHLWIHFRSDENIEYKGFKAVYEFIPRPTSLLTPELRPCILPVAGNEGFPKKGDIDNETLEFNAKYSLPIDCIWVITVKEGWRIQLSFKDFVLAKPNDCDSNFVDVFSDHTDIPSRNKNFCGSIADTVSSSNNVMFIRFFAEPRAYKSMFEAIFTAYRENDKSNSECADDEFNCEDATCISDTLKCNGRFNCRFRWDEDDCENSPAMPLSENHIIIIMVIFSLILSGMCFTFIFNCIKKLIRDHHTIQEYIRESREQQLNELGKQQQEHQLKDNNKVSRSRSNSSHSTESPHPMGFISAAANTPCYVPGGEMLPIQIRSENSSTTLHNGGNPYGWRNGAKNGKGSTEPIGAQTERGSDAHPLNHRHRGHYHNEHQYNVPQLGGTGGFGTHHYKQHDASNTTSLDDDNNGGPERQPEMCDSACQTRESLFTTNTLMGHNYNNSEHSTPNHSVQSINSKPSPPAPFSTFGYKKEMSKYRAEATIDMEREASTGDGNKPKRPYSVQTTKSAPDVIVTH